MSKQSNTKKASKEFDAKSILTEGEELLWQDKPSKGAYILNKIFEKKLTYIIMCIIVGIIGLISIFSSEMEMKERIIVLVVLAIIMFPVWIRLSKIALASKEWKKTEYVVTNKRIVVKTGIIKTRYNSLFYSKIKNVDLSVGVIDRILRVGDISIMTEEDIEWFYDIKNAVKVYGNIQKMVTDMQSDINFPNEKRPNVNPGYNTKLK